jgi:hypothetical protein
MRSFSSVRLASFSLFFSSCSASFSWRGVRLRFFALACFGSVVRVGEGEGREGEGAGLCGCGAG